MINGEAFWKTFGFHAVRIREMDEAEFREWLGLQVSAPRILLRGDLKKLVGNKYWLETPDGCLVKPVVLEYVLDDVDHLLVVVKHETGQMQVFSLDRKEGCGDRYGMEYVIWDKQPTEHLRKWGNKNEGLE